MWFKVYNFKWQALQDLNITYLWFPHCTDNILSLLCKRTRTCTRPHRPLRTSGCAGTAERWMCFWVSCHHGILQSFGHCGWSQSHTACGPDPNARGYTRCRSMLHCCTRAWPHCPSEKFDFWQLKSIKIDIIETLLKSHFQQNRHGICTNIKP